MVTGAAFVARRFVFSAKPSIAVYQLPYIQTFDDVDLRNWISDSGVWTIRTGTLSQTIGGETRNFLHIPYQLPEDTPYHASVYITLKKDTIAAGLTFNAQYPNQVAKQQRVYLYRPTKDILQLVAGYMDDIGSFVPQAEIPLDINTTEFRLDLYVYTDTYLVQLNGQRLIEKRPLFYHNGLLGLYTIASALFDNFQLTAADNPNPGDQVYTSDFDQTPGGAGWVPFRGDWRVVDSKMTQNDPAAIDAGIGYETSTFQDFALRATFTVTQGTGVGVLFNMPSPYQLNGAQLVRYSDETDALLWGYYDAVGVFNRQGFTNIAPPGATPHTLKVFSGGTSYDIFLDEQLIARDVPLQTSRGSVGLITSRATAGYSLVEVFPLFGANRDTPQTVTPAESLTSIPKTATSLPAKRATIAPKPAATQRATALPPATQPLATKNPSGVLTGAKTSFVGDFNADFKASGWKIIRGDWAFSGGNLVQTNAQAVDQSIVYTLAAYTDFSLTVSLAHQSGYGAGVLFNMPYTDRLNGAHLVRYSDRRPGAIFWGYFDMTGKFVGEGYADVPDASTDRHTFRIVSKKTTYDLYLDDKLIVKNLALQQTYGYFGLLVSQAGVAYEQVGISGSAAVAPENTTNVVDAFSDVKILSGKWNTSGNVITQQVTDLGEYILNSGAYASEFTLEANISLPNGGQTGGGFIFHMPDRGSRKGAYMVRLVNGGESIFWGYFDENSKFQGLGSANLQKAEGYLIVLAVRGDRMDVTVNGKMIFQDMKLTSSEGWFGLLAHGGIIRFKDVKATILSIPGKQ